MLVVCVVSMYFLVAFFGKLTESYRIDQRAAQVREQIRVLEAQNKALQEKLVDYSTDGYVETMARDKLNLARPGDRSLVAITADEPVAWVEGAPDGADSTLLPPEFGHLGEWVLLFFGSR